MTRSMMRLLFAMLVAISLVAGFTAGPAQAASVQRADVTTPSEGCAAEYGTFVDSATTYSMKNKQVQKDNKRVKKSQAKVAKAKTAKQKKRAKRQLSKSRKTLRRHEADRTRAKQKAIADYYAWQDCESDAPVTPTDPTTPSPIQALCDAGLPQAVCDAFSMLPVPPPGSGGDSPIQAICDAGIPQALCDAATLPGTDGESPLQPLCDAGLPQAVCDAAQPPAPTDPTDPPGPLDPLDPVLDPICAILPIPGLCP